MSNPIVPFDEQTVKDELHELVRKTSRRPSTRSSTRRPPSRRRRALRAHRREGGVPSGTLRARLHHHVGPGHTQDAQAHRSSTTFSLGSKSYPPVTWANPDSPGATMVR